MSGPVDVLRHADAESLAEAAAGRLVTTLVERQQTGKSASVCLTGGGIGTAVLRAIANSSARGSVDWSHVDVWWGDERYVETGSPDRNETSARAALLDQLPLDPGRVHPFPAPEDSIDVADSAATYAEALRMWGGDEPSLDIMLLGIGPDGHVASLFPEQPALHDARLACAVTGAPKPPPVRGTVTMPVIRHAREVWILASGQEKAVAVRLALLAGAGESQIPAAAARGRERTLFLLDHAAASQLPEGFARPSA
ncbi:MAG: 6-phosphogluconolactonase [Candidatus Nanopelagicales bacterium]|jgi:6-phosphogluconolactonase|nr:6-phosphogluconolactonase [Candidatus Nanopelagicales bacterium]